MKTWLQKVMAYGSEENEDFIKLFLFEMEAYAQPS